MKSPKKTDPGQKVRELDFPGNMKNRVNFMEHEMETKKPGLKFIVGGPPHFRRLFFTTTSPPHLGAAPKAKRR